jgi:hypothetical protein
MTFLLAPPRFLVRDQLIRNDLQEVIFVGTFLSTILNFDRKSGGGGGGDRDGNKNLFEKCFFVSCPRVLSRLSKDNSYRSNIFRLLGFAFLSKKILISFPCVLTDVQQESDFDFDLLEIDINCKKVS